MVFKAKKGLTWKDIVKIEPEIKELYQKAKSYRGKTGPGFCVNEVFYREFKPVIVRLAGDIAYKPKLRSSRVYDIVYYKILNALSGCKHDRPLC